MPNTKVDWETYTKDYMKVYHLNMVKKTAENKGPCCFKTNIDSQVQIKDRRLNVFVLGGQ